MTQLDTSFRLPRDTTPAAAEAQATVYRGLTPTRRIELALELSLTARALLRARLCHEHPDWTDAQLDRDVLRHALPDGRLPGALR